MIVYCILYIDNLGQRNTRFELASPTIAILQPHTVPLTISDYQLVFLMVNILLKKFENEIWNRNENDKSINFMRINKMKYAEKVYENIKEDSLFWTGE